MGPRGTRRVSAAQAAIEAARAGRCQLANDDLRRARRNRESASDVCNATDVVANRCGTSFAGARRKTRKTRRKRRSRR